MAIIKLKRGTQAGATPNSLEDGEIAINEFDGKIFYKKQPSGTPTGVPLLSDPGLLSGFRNKIINGDGRINQRGASTIGDDTYGHDRHYALTQTGNITVSTLTAPAVGIASMMRLTQPNASAQRMGYAQIIEAAETYELRGRTVTLGGKLRYSSAAPIRFAVLEWTGTADQVTSDVVNSWTSANYTAGNFFISSNLTVAAVGSITPVANTITGWSIMATISSSANNLIVFYWTQDTAAQNATLDMRWYLVEGDATAEDDPFSPRHIQQEIALCQRYYEKSYNLDVAPGTVTTTGQLGGQQVGSDSFVAPCHSRRANAALPLSSSILRPQALLARCGICPLELMSTPPGDISARAHSSLPQSWVGMLTFGTPTSWPMRSCDWFAATADWCGSWCNSLSRQSIRCSGRLRKSCYILLR